MFPVEGEKLNRATPAVTYTLFALNAIIFLWDREMRLFGPPMVFGDLGMRPVEVVAALGDGDRFPLVTLFTSLFLHGNWIHFTGNMIYLLVFGPGVEQAIGSYRFALGFIVWGMLASAAHIIVDPSSAIPTIGASGAIGGVMGAYLLLFPVSKLKIFALGVMTRVNAWIMLAIWFAWQVFLPQQGTANWAHVGGFLAGMLTVLFLGGGQKVIHEGRKP